MTRTLAWFLALGLVTGCGSKMSTVPDGSLPELAIAQVSPQTVLPGTWIHVLGQGFEPPGGGSLTVVLERDGGDSWMRLAEVDDDENLRFQVDPELFSALGGPGTFHGLLKVRADYTSGGSQTVDVPVGWDLVQQLQPRLDFLSAAIAEEISYLGSDLEALGGGFLLPGEGRSELRLSGTFTLAASGDDLPVDGNLILLEADDRTKLLGPLPASGFGVQPGTFYGDITPVNVHEGGNEVAGAGLTDVSIELGPTFLTRSEPSQASRGQWIDFYGRGFVAGSATVVLRIEGTFTHRDGQVVSLQGDDALQIVPEVISGGHMRYVLRVSSDGQGGVEGLGSQPGVLRANVTPEVYYGADLAVGYGLADVEFTVLPQKQVVFISYLPGFTDALRDFGLRNVSGDIQDRIKQVVDRDYADFSVEFRTVRPADYLEYAVIEVGGEDPNGRDLLGLDNTMGKDTGNIYFDDVVGGLNADSRESGTYAYGGVFVKSFLLFSPKHPSHMPISSDRFDDLFGPFISDQGGKQVEAGEYPDGARGEQIGMAIHALGSMLGNTIVHEIGHTLGMATGPPDQFHNLPPGPNQIMDAGADRSFEERAEIDGQGPATWTAENRAYLQEYLPR